MKENGIKESKSKIVELISLEELEQMNDLDKESYLNKLTTEQYESLPISGGESIISKADYRLGSYQKRKEWVEKTLENGFEEFQVGISTMLQDDRQFSEQKVPRALDFLGSYLLESLDIKSPRALEEYPFYVDERAYESRKHNRETISFDPQESVIVFEDKGNGEHVEYSERLVRLINMIDLPNMSYKEKRRLVTKVLKEKDNTASDLQFVMTKIYQEIITGIKKEEDRELLDLIIIGKTESEIAVMLGSSQQNINKKVKRIINKIGK